MEHLEDEDIARMIDGTISKRERERFLEHLSGCDSCLTVYNESLKFVEQEGKEKSVLKMPNLGGIADRFWQTVKSIFATRRLIPVYAVLLIVVVLLPFLLKENVQVKYIEDTTALLESRGVHSFVGSNNEMYAAVRAGIFTEELSLLVDYGGKEELRGKLVKWLINELKVLFSTGVDSLLPDLSNLEEGTFDAIVQRIRDMLEKRSLEELFQFGRFVEQGILSCTDGKRPLVEEVEKYRSLVASQYQDKLPPGVLKELNKFSAATGINESKEILTGIKDIFLAVE